MFGVSCPNKFVYLFGESQDSNIAGALAVNVVYLAKLHTSSKLIYAKNFYTDGIASTYDKYAGGSTSPDG